MAIVINIILLIIIFILGVICVKRGAQISSLKNQIEFLEYSLEEFTEKNKKDPNRI
jgi:predicted Holliday junction resolvase-like endonuclease